MADIARMSPEAVQGVIANYQSRSHEFHDVVEAIKGTMFDLQGTWTGAAEQAFEGQVRALLANLTTVEQSVQGAIGKLQLAIAKYEEVERKNVAGANAVESTPKSSYVE